MESPNEVTQNSGLRARPKDWDVLTDSEKVGRMREIVKNLQKTVAHQYRQIDNLRGKLRRHEHRDGKVVEVKEMQDYDSDSLPSTSVGSLTADKFF